MPIAYQEVNDGLLMKIAARYGEVAKNHLHREEGSLSLAALDGDLPVGFLSVYTRSLPTPLDYEKDAYIDIIEVDRESRRRGIARELIRRGEEWAKGNKFPQIRAWSSEDKIEAIPMWYALGYCMCPATIWLERIKESVSGYYVAKRLQ